MKTREEQRQAIAPINWRGHERGPVSGLAPGALLLGQQIVSATGYGDGATDGEE